MVFFTCNACGEALKKNQVEKHTMRCRNCEMLSCVDCGKNFWGNDYESHIKCITEEQKYCGKGYVPKVNKGEVKQEQWIEKVQKAIENSKSNPKLKGVLERLKDYPNIPRKKSKFENFLKNSFRVNSDPLIGLVWDALMATAGQDIGVQNGHEKAKTINESVSHKVPTNDVLETDNIEGKEQRKKKANKEKNTNENSDNTEERKGKSRKRKLSEPEEIIQEVTEKSAEVKANSNSQLQGESSVDGHKLSKRERKEERSKKANKKEKKDKNDNNCSNEGKQSKKRKLSEIEGAEVENQAKKTTESLQDKGIFGRTTNPELRHVCEGEDDEETLEPKKKKSKKVKFNWEATILTVLKSKGEISLKKLQKKVINEFAAQDAANYSEDNLGAMFQKKVKKMAQVKVFKDRVKLK